MFINILIGVVVVACLATLIVGLTPRGMDDFEKDGVPIAGGRRFWR